MAILLYLIFPLLHSQIHSQINFLEVSDGSVILGFFTAGDNAWFYRKMNTGLLCIAFALLLGRMAGISDAEIIKGFNASLFLMLLGVTYLFSLAQINGSLDLLAQKVISLAGKRVYLIPIIIYVFSIILAALGPGSVPTMAIMMVFLCPWQQK